MSRRSRFLVGVFVLLALSLPLVPSVAAKPAPRFFETVVVEDVDGDYAAPGNGALDLVGVHVAEKFAYNPDQRQGDFSLVVRWETRAPREMQCGSTIAYSVQFKVGSATKTVEAQQTSPPPPGNAACIPVPTAPAILTPFGIEIGVSSATLGIAPGTNITGFVGWTSTVSGDQKVRQDVAPYDNRNAPYAPNEPLPSAGLRSHMSIGVFPFVTVAPVTPPEQYSVNGGEVKYIFQFISHPELSDDAIRVLFAIPEGWQLSPSQGTTGPNPEGQLTGGSSGQPRDFAFTASSNGIVNEGEAYDIYMTVITQSGGHVYVPTRAVISGPRISDPNYTFELLTPSGLVAKESNEIRFSVGTALGPLEGARLRIDVSKPGGARQTVDATSVGNGTYKAVYTFPGEGTYILDVYIASLKPSPHQEFTVEVGGGGAFSSGLAWLGAVTALGAAFLRRRSQ